MGILVLLYDEMISLRYTELNTSKFPGKLNFNREMHRNINRNIYVDREWARDKKDEHWAHGKVGKKKHKTFIYELSFIYSDKYWRKSFPKEMHTTNGKCLRRMTTMAKMYRDKNCVMLNKSSGTFRERRFVWVCHAMETNLLECCMCVHVCNL